MWSKRDRFSKLANVCYSNLADKATQGEMAELLAKEGKAFKPPTLLANASRGNVSPLGGSAKAPGRPESKA